MDLLTFLRSKGIRWQPVKLDTSANRKRPLQFSDGTMPDAQEMRRMAYTTDEGKPVLSEEEMKRRQETYTGVETNYIWVDTTYVNVIDVDCNLDRGLARKLPQTRSIKKGLPHAFVRKTNPPVNATRKQIGEGSDLLCGQVCVQRFDDKVTYANNALEMELNITSECADGDGTFGEYIQDLDPEKLKAMKPLINVACACKNLGISKEKLESVMPEDCPYKLDGAWSAEPMTQGIGTLKLYGKTEYAQHESDYETWRQQFELYAFKLRRETMYGCEEDDGSYTLYSKQSMQISYSHWGPKHLKRWLNGEEKRRYERLDFLPPPYHGDKNVYNTWRGFWWEKHQPLPLYTNGDGGPFDIQIFERFLKVLAGDDTQESFGLLRGFLGQMLTEPGKPPHKMPVIYSPMEGVGKTTFFEEVMKRVLGSDLFYSGKFKQVFAGFDNPAAGRLLVLADEASGKTTKQWQDDIQRQVTKSYVSSEKKYQSRVELLNTCRFAIATNDIKPIDIKHGGRRYAVFEVKQRPSAAEFAEFREAMCDNDKIKAFIGYLMDHAWSVTDLTYASGPDTNALQAMKLSSSGNVFNRFLESMLDGGGIPPSTMTQSALREKLYRWAQEQNDWDSLRSDFGDSNNLKSQVRELASKWGGYVWIDKSNDNNKKGKVMFDWAAIRKELE